MGGASFERGPDSCRVRPLQAGMFMVDASYRAAHLGILYPEISSARSDGDRH